MNAAREGGDRTLSAEVVMRPPGADLADVRVTAENIDRLRPDEAGVRAAQAYFGERGLVVGELTGLSFSITGPRSRFEEVFGLPIEVGDTRGVAGASVGGGGMELPLERLPADLAAPIHAVTFTPPPDFGPGNP